MISSYRTTIFKPNKKKKQRQTYYLIAGTLVIAVLAVAYIFEVLFPVISLMIGLGYFYLRFASLNQDLNWEDIKPIKEGSHKADLIIAQDHFVINEVNIPFKELNELVIYVDDYHGKRRDLFFKSYGGENEIRFLHKERITSFNYLIRNKKEFEELEELVRQIEDKFPAR